MNISQELQSVVDQIDQIEFDYEHGNQKASINNAKKLMHSPLYHELPIKSKLKLYYCQLFYILLPQFINLESDFFDLFDSFERDFDISQIEDPKEQIYYYTIKTRILLYKREHDQAKSIESIGNDVISKLELNIDTDNETMKNIALFYWVYNGILYRRGEFDKEVNYLEKAYKWLIHSGNYYHLLGCALGYSDYYSRYGKTKEVHQILSQTYNYYKKEGQEYYACMILLLISWFYYGYDLKKALKYLNESLEQIKSIQLEKESEDFHFYYWFAYAIKGLNFLLTGDVKGAIELSSLSAQHIKQFQQSFNQISQLYANSLGNLAEVVTLSGDYDLALKYQLEALDIREKASKSKIWIIDGSLALSYFDLIKLYLKLENSEKVQEYLLKLEKLTQKHTNEKNIYVESILAKFKLAKALVKIKNESLEDLFQAKMLLKEIITENIEFSMIAEALIPLIDITIQEYKVFQNEKNYQEIVGLINRLEELGEKNNSIRLKVYSLLLAGKMDLIQGKIDKAEELYKKSLSIAKEYNNMELLTKSQSELQKLQKDRGNWEMKLSTTTIKERFDLLDLENYVKEGQQYLGLKKDP